MTQAATETDVPVWILPVCLGAALVSWVIFRIAVSTDTLAIEVIAVPICAALAIGVPGWVMIRHNRKRQPDQPTDSN